MTRYGGNRMNDEVRSLLKQSSKQVKTLKEKKDTKVAKEIEALNNVLEKAKNNKAKFYGFMLKKAVLEYTEDPISILNHFSFKRNTNYTVAYKMLDGNRISGLPGSKIARLYNYGICQRIK